MPDAIGGEVAFPGRKSHVVGVSCWCAPGVGHSDQDGLWTCVRHPGVCMSGNKSDQMRKGGEKNAGGKRKVTERECVSASVCVLKCMLSV